MVLRGILLLIILIITAGFSNASSDYMFLFIAVFVLTGIVAGIAFYKERSSINLDYRPKKRKKKRDSGNAYR
jgi:hypothetical protein